MENATLAGKIALILFFIPFLAFACSAKSNVWDPTILKGPLVTCTGVGAGGTDNKSCQDLCDLICTTANIIYFAIAFVLWIIIPIMFVWGGIQLIVSTGNPGGIESGKKTMTAAAIGLLIVVCAYLIVYTMVSVIGIANIGGFSSGSGSASITCHVQQ
jgi:hypothetical protein